MSHSLSAKTIKRCREELGGALISGYIDYYHLAVRSNFCSESDKSV